jgi:uncharacterized YccA/Bax inhibitor family protein
MRSGNPVLRNNVFQNAAGTGDGVMTVQGTVNKSFGLLFLIVIAASLVWSNPVVAMALIIPAAIIGFILAIVTTFKKEMSPITAPIYAAVEGVVIGGVSFMFESMYPGIVMQAVTLTFGTLFCMLILYKTGIIKVTQKFRMGVVAATGGIFLIYLFSIIMGFFGVKVPFMYGGAIGIGFSLVVVGIAALNLVLDFDFIDRGSEFGAPKYMEWYGAFAIMVTLVWLYLEMLRLLSKLARR